MILNLTPLNIEGFTGVGERADAECTAAFRRWADAHPEADPQGPQTYAESMRLVALMDTVLRYADVRDRLLQERVARDERDRLLRLVETRWEALATASAWCAAHHAYVVAVDEARTAVDMWRERAETALHRQFFCVSDRDKAAYRQIQEAGHPTLERAQAALDPAPGQTAGHLRASLDQTHERRRQLAAETLQYAGASQ